VEFDKLAIARFQYGVNLVLGLFRYRHQTIEILIHEQSHKQLKKHTDKRHRVYFVVIIVFRTACVSPVFAFYITFLAASNGSE